MALGEGKSKKSLLLIESIFVDNRAGQKPLLLIESIFQVAF